MAEPKPRNPPRSQWFSNPISLSISSSSLSGNRSGLPPNPRSTISLSRFQILSDMSSKNFSHCLQETDPWRIHHMRWQSQEYFGNAKLIVSTYVPRISQSFNRSLLRLVGAENHNISTERRKGFHCHIAEPPKLMLPAVQSPVPTPTRAHQGHRRTPK